LGSESLPEAAAGSHVQLMRNRGLYAELYELQASAYE
jgi:ABC-type multidrug transport system fused ATPase/permease subunit